MSNLYIPATSETPEINFDFTAHKISISGESYPENAMAFYSPIRASLADYLNSQSAHAVEASFSLTYFNSSSTKLIRALFAMMNEASSKGKRIVAQWLHDPEDDMMLEFGQDLREEFKDMELRVVACVAA